LRRPAILLWLRESESTAVPSRRVYDANCIGFTGLSGVSVSINAKMRLMQFTPTSIAGANNRIVLLTDGNFLAMAYATMCEKMMVKYTIKFPMKYFNRSKRDCGRNANSIRIRLYFMEKFSDRKACIKLIESCGGRAMKVNIIVAESSVIAAIVASFSDIL